jgi:hypothetical protein
LLAIGPGESDSVVSKPVYVGSLYVGVAITSQVGSKIIYGNKKDIGTGWFCLVSATGTKKGHSHDHQEKPAEFLSGDTHAYSFMG